MPPVRRSRLFAFICIMGRDLHPVDFEAFLMNDNKVMQLFYTEENGLHYVNLKVKTPITRTRAASALHRLEGVSIELPPHAVSWPSIIYTGSELSDEGGFIREIILRHKTEGRPDFYQYLAPGFWHPTIMINNPAALPDPAVGLGSRSSSVMTELYIPNSVEEVLEDDGSMIPVLYNVMQMEETLPDGSPNRILEWLRLQSY